MSKDAWIVWHEGGGYMQVFADSAEDAIEEYYETLHSILGHHLGICSCFGEPKPLDRNQVNRPTRVEQVTKFH